MTIKEYLESLASGEEVTPTNEDIANLVIEFTELVNNSSELQTKIETLTKENTDMKVTNYNLLKDKFSVETSNKDNKENKKDTKDETDYSDITFDSIELGE